MESCDGSHGASSDYPMTSHYYPGYIIPELLHRRPMNEISGPASRLRRVHGYGAQSPHASSPLPLPGLLLLRHIPEDQGNMLNNYSLLSRPQ